MAFARVGTRLRRPLVGLLPPLLPAPLLRLSPPWEGELEATKKHTSLSASDTAVHTLPEEPFLHRSSTGPDVQQVAFRRLVTPLHRKGVDELLETSRELTVLTEDQRRDAADLLEPSLERPQGRPDAELLKDGKGLGAGERAQSLLLGVFFQIS